MAPDSAHGPFLDRRRLPGLAHPITHVLARAQTRMLLIDDIQRTNADPG